jgi:predicted RNA-binding protein with PUA-like domain
MAKKGSSQHFGKEPLHRKIRNKTKAAFAGKPAAPGSHPHVLHKVPLNYVLYVSLVVSIAVIGVVFVSMTKKRDQTDVLGANIMQSWAICSDARRDLIVDVGVVMAFSDTDYSLTIRSNGDRQDRALSWAPEVKLFNRNCVRQPIRKLQIGDTVRYYHTQKDTKDTVFIIEKSSN